ncbi:TOMM precursor leader peptide-binding protein [Streptomyces malaysiensis subsp. malaysiensis]|uniref:ThiF family adenylyltransferase n=1 Tax=Streptomyces malaysiensis TaxID=92644 RepID=A0ABX6WAL7_STRMQ|nr:MULTISPECIES: ThiF family adenylyltransferase [Streptomyces]QPI58480.1 ThiF family adenylyltransferase [Streptomyces solisilvae]UHH20078.1 ThiF family adenylyltransferase [Streptomyces sp. HNM0561]
MHPMLKPALRRGWRSRDTVQFGVARAHAVVMGPVDTATGSFLELLDGTRGLPLLRQEARAIGLPEGRADALVDRLAAAGLLDEPKDGGEPAAALDRLRPDAGALSVLHPEPGAAARLLAARRAMRVQVRGAGRVGAAVAAALSGSGVGRVDVVDGGCVEPWDVAPGGLSAEQIGERRDLAARRVVRQAAPGPLPRRSARERTPAEERTSSGETGLALVVIAPRDGLAAYAPDPEPAQPLLASGTPHLYAGIIEATGVVGPLVVPGITPCAGCAAAGRAEREPAWPRMLAQWRSGRRRTAPACDTALAMVVAGLTAVQALAFLDGRPSGGAGVRWELALPSLIWEARPVEAHPGCGCGAAGEEDAVYASAAEAPHATMSR